MAKMIFDKEQTKNLLKMLRSKDEENQVTALLALNNADLAKSLGELIVLYKFGKPGAVYWSNEAPKAWKKLNEIIGENTNLTSGTCLSIMTKNKTSKASIELYFECLVEDMKNFMEQVGYPVELFEMNFKLKGDE
jgi:hypothetical protein